MWTPIAFVVILAAAASAEYGFKVGNQYQYEVTSNTFTSLQQVTEQYSGVSVRAQLTVTPVKEDELIATITNPEKAQIHTTLPTGTDYEIPQGLVQYTPFTLSKEPFVIKLQNGVVDELVVSKDLPIWEVNIIRSLVSQFQVDTQGRRVIPSKINSLPRGDENTAVYKVMEDTVEGECEVLYDITPLPKYVLQRMPYLAPTYHSGEKQELIDIMKTKNFSNCEQRPGYHFGLTELTNWTPTTNKMGGFLSRSSISRVVVTGTLRSYTIQSSVTTNKVILSPQVYNNQKGEVVSRVNVTLVAVQSSSGHGTSTTTPTNPQTLKKLVYDFNSPFTTDVQARERWGQRQEQNIVKTTGGDENSFQYQMRSTRSIDEKTLILANEGWYQPQPKMTQAPETPFLPYFVGYGGHSIQHSKDLNVNQVVRKMTEKIGQTLQEQSHVSKENTLERFTTLTAIVRTMNAKQLEQTVQELYTAEPENTQEVSGTKRNAWMVFRDALAQAGTGPALTCISTLITTKKVKGTEAATLVSTMAQTARYPTTEYMNTFFELVKSPEVVNQPRLNTTIITTFTKLVRLAQVNPKTMHTRYPVHAFGYLTRPDDTTVTEVYIPYFAQQLEQAVGTQDSHKIQTYITALGNIAHPKILQVFEPYLEGKQTVTDYQRTLIVVCLRKLAEIHPKTTRPVLYKIYSNVGEVYQVRVAAVYNLMKTVPTASMLQRMAQFTHEDPSYQVRSAVKSAIESAALLVTKTNTELRKNAQSAVNMVVPTSFGVQYSRLNLTDYLVKGLHLGYTQTYQYIGSEDSIIPKSIFYKVLGNLNGLKTSVFRVDGMVSSVQGLQELLHNIFSDDEDVSGGKTGTGSGSGAHGEVFTPEKIAQLLNIEHTMKEQVEGKISLRFGNIQRFFAFDNHTIEKLPEYMTRYLKVFSQGKVYNYQKFFSCDELTIGLPTATGLPVVYTLNTPTYYGVKGKVQVNAPEAHTTQTGYQLPKVTTVTQNVEVTYATNIQGQISFVTPYDNQRYISGYNKKTHVNLPIKGSVTVDVPKRHLEVEVKPIEKRGDYKLFHYSTTPYTAVKEVVDFKPITEGSNTKVMGTKPLTVVKEQFGGKVLGMGFRLEAKTGKRGFNWKNLIHSWLQRHNTVSGVLYPTTETTIDNTNVDLYFDGQSTTAESIKFTTTYHKITPKEQFTPTTEGQTKVQEFYQQATSGIKGATVYITDFGVKVQGQTPIQYTGALACARSTVDSQTKFTTYLHKTYGGETSEICLDGTVKDTFVSPVDFEQVVQTEPHTEVTTELKFGKQCGSGAKVTLTGKLGRSQERREYLQTLPQVQKCKTEIQQGNKLLANCRNATIEAGLMDKYRFTVQYEGVPEPIKNVTYQVYSVLRHLGYPYVTESLTTQGTTEGKQIEVDVNFSPDLKTANVYVSSPVGVAQFRDVHVGSYGRVFTVLHPTYSVTKRMGWNAYKQSSRGYCTVDKTQTKTFDNQTYTSQLGNVWHVMSVSVPKTDNQGTFDKAHEFSVLVREDSGNNKEVQFTFGYTTGPVVYIVPGQGKASGTVTVNGQPVHFDETGLYVYKTPSGTVVFKVFVLPTGQLQFVAKKFGFELLYDQSRVQLTLSHEYRNRVGGLCGVYNGEHFDYVTPQGYVLQSPEEFAATWALSSEGRIGELKKKAQEHSTYKKTVILTNAIGGEEGKYHEGNVDYYTGGSDEVQGEGGKCTTKRIMVIERDGKHCFSVHPQTACKTGCQVEKTKTMSADFICVNKTKTTSHWAQMVARGAHPNFKNKGNAQTMQFEGPEVCTE